MMHGQKNIKFNGYIALLYNSSEHFKECHPRCVGELDRWEGSQKRNSYII